MTASTEKTTQAQAQHAHSLRLISEKEEHYGKSLTQLAIQRLKRDYLTLAAGAILIIFAILAILAPVISDAFDVNYRSVEVSNAFQKIGAPGHPLGTDDLGRDHLSRLLYGGRVSIGIAAAAAALSIGIGIALGLLAGFYQGGRWRIVDDFLMWFITTLNSVPFFFLLLIISAVLTRSVFSLILILGVLGWTGTMRLVRGETLAQREREYIISARAIGSSDLRIMFTHILPNIFSIIVVNLAIDIGVLILVESGLSFLNLGVVQPTPSWGNMLTNSQTFFTKGVHLVIMPGVLIVVTVLCLYLIGDGLRDAFDPQANKK